MRVLSIDTSTAVGGVAVFDSDRGLLAEMRVNLIPKKNTHSEKLMPAIDYILKESDTALSAVDAYVAAAGPGSFTGLRVGINTVKGFALVTGKPVISISTFEGLALNFPFAKYPVCILLDARKEDIYGAAYSIGNSGSLDEIVTCGVYKIGEICEKLAGEKKVIFTGDASILYKDKLQELTDDNAIFAGIEHHYISPAALAAYGLKKLQSGAICDAKSFKPLYLKRPQGVTPGGRGVSNPKH
ncbi:MAG: tRNA (adenosine(37)-N6)-threonylcarbamoyltransferase complex dimerization subunit type 1 TsaB [Nitrospirae bacterium]|nr:tRNA (adenosine(37)-N6)-threonylcarbamoyltransferase complex dimerization subunit type 1 TsaB [Nitrospirota bacterium]MBF0534327.1 tRNA (adenosine(37)-N6)-threonylcarbamoyltransferase complex dimerization subunit type 1 TsaB [Nitrospirota bacterium]MBF0615692.1 tRNA (adenosine(37)-N6)-threonylcarbamoyltransferase complex dimerization subunit type 1 TsaB [Nitrospirota bacterium]